MSFFAVSGFAPAIEPLNATMGQITSSPSAGPDIALTPISTTGMRQQRYQNASSSNPRRQMTFLCALQIALPSLSGLLRLLILLFGSLSLRQDRCRSSLLMTAYDTNTAFILLDVLGGCMLISLGAMWERAGREKKGIYESLAVMGATNALGLWAALALVVAVKWYRIGECSGES